MYKFKILLFATGFKRFLNETSVRSPKKFEFVFLILKLFSFDCSFQPAQNYHFVHVIVFFCPPKISFFVFFPKNLPWLLYRKFEKSKSKFLINFLHCDFATNTQPAQLSLTCRLRSSASKCAGSRATACTADGADCQSGTLKAKLTD